MKARSIELAAVVLLFWTQGVMGQPLRHIRTIDTEWPQCAGLATSGETLLVGVHGPRVEFLQDGALLAYDVSDPGNPRLLGELEVRSVVGDIKVVGALAYLANHVWGLRIVDVSDPSDLREVGHYNVATGPYTSSIIGIDVSGDYAYVTDHWKGLKTIDVSDPSSASIVSTLGLNYFEHDVKVRGSTAYVTSAHWPWGSLLAAVDVTNPSAPYVIGSVSTAFRADRVTLTGDLAYVAAQEGGLQIIDISEPSAMEIVASYGGPATTNDVAIRADVALLAAGEDGLVVLDVSNPCLPVLLGAYPTEGLAVRVVASGGNVYVSCQNGKVIIFGPQVLEVGVDIKPGSCPNPLNLKSKGVLPVAVLGAEHFDVRAVDPATVRLTREGVEGKVVPIRWGFEDVTAPSAGDPCECRDLDGDGYTDLVLKFDTQEVVKVLGLEDAAGTTVRLILTGNPSQDRSIQGEDCVRVLQTGRKEPPVRRPRNRSRGD